jgi:hypothetical protein
VYNELMANEPVKVPEDQFKAVLRALLNAPPMPADEITNKRQRAAGSQKPGPKRRTGKKR